MERKLDKRKPKEENRVNIHEVWEIKYWAEKFNVSPEQIVDAVGVAGTDVRAVQRILDLEKRKFKLKQKYKYLFFLSFFTSAAITFLIAAKTQTKTMS